MPITGPLRGALALVVVLFVAAGTGRVVGVGPLAGTVPPDQVTDPREMIARSLQATLDAASVHVGGTLEGILPGALLRRDEAAVDLSGTTFTADVRPARRQDAGPGDITRPGRRPRDDHGLDRRVVPVDGGAWQKVPVGEATSGTGVDVNPLTLVDRMRSYLATSGRWPVVTDVACASASGRCHQIRLDAGTDPAGVLTALLPGARDGSPPPVSTTITLQTDAADVPAGVDGDRGGLTGRDHRPAPRDGLRGLGRPVVIEEPPVDGG